MDPPWSLRIEDEAPLTLVAIVRGERVDRARRAASRPGCGAGDVAITRGPDPYIVADDPGDARRRSCILPGERCRTPTAPSSS